jgi:tRNA threonylcarbamoyladenosine biosynthesis protein TsaB
MKLLALETGARMWGAACAALDAATGEAALLSAQVSAAPRELSQQLFGALQSTLDAAQWDLGDVDALAVGLGPGSWTGLRIGLSAAKTLAQTRGWTMAGVPSFDATAQAAWRARDDDDASTLLLVAAPCRPGEIYAKIYEAGADYLAVAQSEWIGAPELVAATLGTEALARGLDAPFLLAGNAATAVGELLAARDEAYAVVEPEFEDVLLELAIAGAAKIASGEDDSALTLQPLYLAPSNAERNLLAGGCLGGSIKNFKRFVEDDDSPRDVR